MLGKDVGIESAVGVGADLDQHIPQLEEGVVYGRLEDVEVENLVLGAALPAF